MKRLQQQQTAHKATRTIGAVAAREKESEMDTYANLACLLLSMRMKANHDCSSGSSSSGKGLKISQLFGAQLSLARSLILMT
jgi:hypothetical protein